MKIYLNSIHKNIITGKHYVYIYLNPDTKIPFYVGKGKNKRAYFHLTESYKRCKNYSKLNIIRKLQKDEKEPIIIFPLTCVSEQEAYDIEQNLIKAIGTIRFKNGPLTNRLIGGWQRTYPEKSEIYDKISKKQKANWENKNSVYHSDEFKAKNIMWQSQSGKDNPRYGDNRTWEELHGKDKAVKLKENISLKQSGKNNSQAKNWKLVDPYGKEYILSGTLKVFCKNNNLSMKRLKANLNKIVQEPKIIHKRFEQMTNNTTGWILYELQNL